MSDRAAPMRFTGIANPIPWARARMATLSPINSPRRFTRGPPLLPGLIEASVCNQSSTSIASPSGPVRRVLELRIPRLTDPPSPYGFPSARTVSPSSRSSSPANATARYFFPAGPFNRSRARSTASCVAATSASMGSVESARVTCTWAAPRTTWKLVNTQPSSSITTPDPLL
jgi:hypothetical protein